MVTKKSFEEYLNDFISENTSFYEALENFTYLFQSDYRFSKAYFNHTIGSQLRKKDPIAFNVGFNEWGGKNGY